MSNTNTPVAVPLIAPSAFTFSYPAVVNRLITDCSVCKAYVPGKNAGTHPQLAPFIGLWDTGATNSVITRTVVDKLGLVSTGRTVVAHANGTAETNTYLVNILLPNGVGVHSLRVSEGILSGADVLIGMDIISKGDFSITMAKGKTLFSFQIPSTHHTDFDAELHAKAHTPVVADKVIGRNELCHCGSGKKYKYCHGK